MAVITEEYRSVLEATHEELGTFWGHGACIAAWPVALSYINELDDIKTIIDYGCGNGNLKDHVDEHYSDLYEVVEYDPGIPSKARRPQPADFVMCCDVLEHVEPNCIDEVLRDIRRVGQKGAYVRICMLPAHTNLVDGRNSHLIVKDAQWWINLLTRYFRVEVDMCARGHIGAFLRPRV